MQRLFQKQISRQFHSISHMLFSGKAYDLVVIGGGPGGYVAAIKAAQLGLKTCCVEKRGALGGTCLNVGCIPSKALLNASHKYYDAKKGFKALGLNVKEITYDWNKVQEKKGSIVSGLTRGVEGLFKKNNVDYYKGLGSFKDKNTIGIKLNDGKNEEVTGKNIIIATGSDVAELKELPFDGKVVVSSTEVLSLPKVPKKMIVIGAGIIGLELGSVYNRLGSEVTVLALTDIIPGSDSDMVKELSTTLKQQGMKILTNTKMDTHKMVDGGIEITTTQKKGKKGPTLKAENCMVAIGRVPYTKDLNLEAVGIQKDKSGRVEINEKFQTAVPHVYAIGDVVRGAMLAHKAEEEGVAVVEIIKNGEGHVNYDCIPSVLYTHPEVAFVGKTEEQLKKEKIQYGKGSFPMAANARAKCNDDFRGLVKVLTDKKTDKILGVHMIGSDAGEMIHEAALAMEYGASSEDVARTCHAHPTLSEAIKEACLAAHFKAIHV